MATDSVDYKAAYESLQRAANDIDAYREARIQRLTAALQSCIDTLNNHTHTMYGDTRRDVIRTLEEAHRAMATHRCKVCGALWRLNPPSAVQPGGSWSLAYGEKCGQCCDNVAMGDQIEEL